MREFLSALNDYPVTSLILGLFLLSAHHITMRAFCCHMFLRKRAKRKKVISKEEIK